MKIKLLPCPFCGFRPDPDEADCIYKVYPWSRVYVLNCYESHGGCSASVLGDSIEEVVKRWNTRSNVSTPF